MKGYTKKEENFCQKLIQCGNQTEAYEFAYNVKSTTPRQIVHQMASKLAKKGKIIDRLNELRNLNAKPHFVNVEKLTAMYFLAYHMACGEKNITAMIQATTGLGRLHGLIVDKSEVKNSGSVTHKHEGVSETLQFLEDVAGGQETDAPSQPLQN